MALAIGTGLAAIVAGIIAEILLCFIIALIIVLIVWILYKIIEAIIDYVRSPTLERTWDGSETIPYNPPAPVPFNKEKIDPKVLDQVVTLLAEIALTKELTEGDHNVYDVHVIDASEPFDNYAPDRRDSNGIRLTSVYLLPLEIYKYGTTKEESVKSRFGMAYNPRYYSTTRRSNIRDRYIYECLKDGRLAPTQWYLYHYAKDIAESLEALLIIGYRTIHGVLPAGNMIVR